jgi:hypothetical protein
MNRCAILDIEGAVMRRLGGPQAGKIRQGKLWKTRGAPGSFRC